MSPIKQISEKTCKGKTNYWKIWTLLSSNRVNALMAQRSAHELHKVPQVTGQKRRALPNATHKMPYLKLN